MFAFIAIDWYAKADALFHGYVLDNYGVSSNRHALFKVDPSSLRNRHVTLSLLNQFTYRGDEATGIEYKISPS